MEKTEIPGAMIHTKDRRRALTLALVVCLQALCAVFFVADVAADLTWAGLDPHSRFEAVIALALIVGVVFGALEMRRTLLRMRRAETAQAIASSAFADLINSWFANWGLTPAEADVALFTLKGLDTPEIAKLRGAAEGTVRVQLARIYSKAGVSNRGQFTSLFIEELLAAPLAETPAE